MIRLFDFDTAEVSQLWAELQKLAQGEVQQVAIHQLPFVTVFNEVELTAIVDDRVRDPRTEYAILGSAQSSSFIWRGTPEEWRLTCAAVEPFTDHCDVNSYAWLTDDLGTMLLMSSSGSW